jgi:hypothetical protein
MANYLKIFIVNFWEYVQNKKCWFVVVVVVDGGGDAKKDTYTGLTVLVRAKHEPVITNPNYNE